MKSIEVSVIIVFRNETRYLERCLASIMNQFQGASGWELILVDSMSNDNSVEILHNILRSGNIRYQLLQNPGKTLSMGWNIGIQHAAGSFIIRPDAHAILQPGYITGALKTLSVRPPVGVVGGLLETKSDTFSGRLIKEALSMRTGVGNSSFRTGEKSGFKDTAVYGLYRKEVFLQVGLLNEKLVRHQDTDLHFRMVKKGFEIYMNDQIKAAYFCRDSLKSLGKQMYDIGYYFSFLIEEKVVGAMKLRHWIPLFFYSFMAILLIAGILSEICWHFFLFFGALYLFTIVLESVWKCLMSFSLYPLAATILIPFIHFNYAFGTFTGLMRLLVRKSNQE